MIHEWYVYIMYINTKHVRCSKLMHIIATYEPTSVWRESLCWQSSKDSSSDLHKISIDKIEQPTTVTTVTPTLDVTIHLVLEQLNFTLKELVFSGLCCTKS